MTILFHVPIGQIIDDFDNHYFHYAIMVIWLFKL